MTCHIWFALLICFASFQALTWLINYHSVEYSSMTHFMFLSKGKWAGGGGRGRGIVRWWRVQLWIWGKCYLTVKWKTTFLSHHLMRLVCICTVQYRYMPKHWQKWHLLVFLYLRFFFTSRKWQNVVADPFHTQGHKQNLQPIKYDSWFENNSTSRLQSHKTFFLKADFQSDLC